MSECAFSIVLNSLGSSSRVYDILEGGGAVRTRSYPARLPHYSTVRAHHRNVGPKSGRRVSHTHNTANAEHHGGEGVVAGRWHAHGGFAAERRLSEAPPPVAAAEYWYPEDDRRVVLLFGERFTRAALLV